MRPTVREPNALRGGRTRRLDCLAPALGPVDRENFAFNVLTNALGSIIERIRPSDPALVPAYITAVQAMLQDAYGRSRGRPFSRFGGHLERLHDRFATLIGKVSERDARTVAGIITATATDPQAARLSCLGLGGRPLHKLSLVQGPLIHLCQDLLPVVEDKNTDNPATAT